MKLAEILAQWNKDSVIKSTALDTEALNIPQLHSKYLQYLSATKSRIHRKKKDLDTLFHDKKRWLQGRMSRDEMDERSWKYDPFDNAAKPMKSEMDSFVRADREVQTLQAEIDELKILEDALLEIMNNINWRHTHIRNAIDYMKFMAGG
jgi:hypothetical protein